MLFSSLDRFMLVEVMSKTEPFFGYFYSVLNLGGIVRKIEKHNFEVM
jgi:hypothetical protein